jgi:hypothetical protein
MTLETRWRPPARAATASSWPGRIIDGHMAAALFERHEAATPIFPSLLTVALPAAVVELLRPAPKSVPGFSGGM